MIPTINAYQVIEKWRDKLASSEKLDAFCLEKYGKSFTIYVGADVKSLPNENNCPFILMIPSQKSEGVMHEDLQVTITLVWSIASKEKTINGKIIEMNNVSELTKFGEIIALEVAEINPSYPISNLEVGYEYLELGLQARGRMDATIRIPVVMGANIDY